MGGHFFNPSLHPDYLTARWVILGRYYLVLEKDTTKYGEILPENIGDNTSALTPIKDNIISAIKISILNQCKIGGGEGPAGCGKFGLRTDWGEYGFRYLKLVVVGNLLESSLFPWK